SLSDIYAMGARPLFALNVVGFPTGTLPLSVLGAILKGGADKVGEAGASIIGGHSIDDPEPKYGLVVTGVVHPEKVLRNAGARVGDDLILTKPLGMGIITTGIKRQKVAAEIVEQVVTTMSTLNRYAAEVMEAVGGVHACTDVTGFGLLGHLREVAAGSRVGAAISLRAVPVLPEAWRLVREGICPGGTRRNLRSLEGIVEWAPGMDEDVRLVLSDAQTSGGLLMAVSKAKSAEMLRRLGETKGVLVAARVGEVTAGPAGTIRVVP
ncbi:MAG TPA: selenide, water dikinase SelD, partial [Candidatus Methylomirabilis sp.]|nr:selenide, water dikinase SelD [Candidatus Methylomirabilis sp.]